MKNRKKKQRIIAIIIAVLLLINIVFMIIPVFNAGAAAPVITTTLYVDNKVVFYSAPEVTVMYNDGVVECDTPPVIMEDRTLVPVRAVFEEIGSTVLWDAAKRKVSVSNNDKDITLYINDKTATVNGKETVMDVAAKIINNRTYVPLRFIAEHSGLNVNWDGTNYIAKMYEPTDNQITSLTYKKSNGNFVVTVKGSKEIKHSYMVLSNPERLVVDFEDSFLKLGTVDFDGNDYISEIRYSQFKLSPNVVRTVFNLNDTTKFSIKKSGTQLVITFSLDEAVKEEIEENEKNEETEDTDEPVIPNSVDGKTIVVLDPGHGGSDPGAIGKDDDGNEVLYEKDPNLEIALLVEKRLKNAGVTVYMTRTTDEYVTLAGRYNYANKMNADLFCSIHNNASENFDTSGTMTMYAYDEPKEGYTISGKEYAAIMQKHMVKALKENNLGARKNSALAVVRGTNMPAVITESLFVSNESDRNRLLKDDTIVLIANAIADGILEVLEKIEC